MSTTKGASVLVERELPLKTLMDLSGRAKSGRGGIVLLGGEAGIGKTTLLDAFQANIRADFRVHWGGCDPLFTPRTLGPIHDMAGGLGPRIEKLLADNAPQTTLFSALLSVFENASVPTVLVIEDVHWADNATLDLIKYLGRRVWFLNLLIVVSFRSDEIGVDHPLSQVLGELPSTATHRIELSPLTAAGVKELSDYYEYSEEDLYERTGGNPFFLTELLAVHGEGTKKIPASITDAVASRLSRLEQEERHLLEEISLIPNAVTSQFQTSLFGPEYATLISKCVDKGFLVQDQNGSIRFRHELARLATLSRVPKTRQQEGHKKILSVLMSSKEKPALDQIVHHADGAMEGDSVLKYAPEAAKRAAQAGAHREAASHLATALRFVDKASPEIAAQLYEDWAYEAGLALRIDGDVLEARRHAVSMWRALGRPEKVAENLRWLSRLHWYRGEAAEASRYSDQAIATLEDMPPSIERAMAYSLRSQLCMLHDRMDDAIIWGQKALELENEFENLDVRIHALNNIGTSMVFRDKPDGIELLQQSLDLAIEHGFHEHAARVYTNLSEYAVEFRDFELAERVLNEGLAYDVENDLDSWIHYLQGRLALLRMKQGRFHDAEAISNGVVKLERLTLLMRLPALQVLAKTRMRLGKLDAESLMSQSLQDAIATEELQHIVPARFAWIEYAWLTDQPDLAVEHLRELTSMEKSDRHHWDEGEIAIWAHRYRKNFPDYETKDLPLPYLLELNGDAVGASQEWERLGSPYKAAMALLEVRGDKVGAAFTKALKLLEPLDAKLAIAKTRSLAKELDVAVILPTPVRGPYRAARNHPLGLTGKEQEVLRHMVGGASNREISTALSRSQRTIEHHVSSILAKLGASNRMGVMLRVQNEPWLVPD